MFCSTGYVLSALIYASYATATCPSVWSELAADLGSFFVSDGTCSDAARAAIRLAFHDCFPGSCNGHIILANECSDRTENEQMTPICSTLSEKAQEYNVGTADIIQFAAAIGMASCTGGPITSFYAGRADSSTASPLDAMPLANTNTTTMVSMFTAKGFSKTDLVALTGAHSIGRKLDSTPLDSTVGEFDYTFYTETSSNESPGFIDADKFMSQSGEVGDEWRAMGKSQEAFLGAFVPAMEKMSLMGSGKGKLVDCSAVVKEYAGKSKVRRRVLLKGRITE